MPQQFAATPGWTQIPINAGLQVAAARGYDISQDPQDQLVAGATHLAKKAYPKVRTVAQMTPTGRVAVYGVETACKAYNNSEYGRNNPPDVLLQRAVRGGQVQVSKAIDNHRNGKQAGSALSSRGNRSFSVMGPSTTDSSYTSQEIEGYADDAIPVSIVPDGYTPVQPAVPESTRPAYDYMITFDDIFKKNTKNGIIVWSSNGSQGVPEQTTGDFKKFEAFFKGRPVGHNVFVTFNVTNAMTVAWMVTAIKNRIECLLSTVQPSRIFLSAKYKPGQLTNNKSQAGANGTNARLNMAAAYKIAAVFYEAENKDGVDFELEVLPRAEEARALVYVEEPRGISRSHTI